MSRSKDKLPCEIVFHPSWWNRHAGIVFDEDFFYDPRRRVEDERKMERVLYERFGRWGLGADRDRDLPQIVAERVKASGDPYRTGICCINIDDSVSIGSK